MSAPAFLQYLGLDTQADEKAVRRAYAHALRQIDQQVQVEQFQQLRQAYEAALQWCRQQLAASAGTASVAAGAAQSSDAVAPQAPAEAAEAPPWWLHGRDASQAFHQAVQELLERPEHTYLDSWNALLRQALDDPRLQDLRARPLFEQHLASWLLAGWQPGHEWLFVAAIDCFDWDRDRRQLAQLGQSGWHMERAIVQYHDFQQLPDKALQARWRRAIARLRDAESPGGLGLDQLERAVPAMLARYPDWLPVITAVPRLAQWREHDRQLLQPATAGDGTATPDKTKANAKIKTKRFLGPWTLLGLIALAVQVLHACNSGGTPGMPAGAAYFSSPSQPATSMPRAYPAPAPDPKVVARIHEHLQRQLKHDYQRPAGVVGKVQAQYLVKLDARGLLTGLELARSSGFTAFDEALRQGLERAQPYPVDAPQELMLKVELP